MKSLYIVIVGCGRLGAHLANLLSQRGHRVVVVDQRAVSFDKLAAESFSGYRVEGDACEPSVLREARLDRADLVITATHADNVNLMVGLVAKRVFGVERVMARVYDPTREQAYLDLGLTTVCPTGLAGQAFLGLVAATENAEGASA